MTRLVLLLLALASPASGAVVVEFRDINPQPPATDSAQIVLAFTAPGDDGMLGRASAYHLSVDDTVYVLDQIPQPAGSSESLAWRIGAPTAFRVRGIDDAGNAADWSNEVLAEPGSASDTYLGMWHSAIDGQIYRKTLWAGPEGFDAGELAPAAPGTPQTAWVVFSESAPQEGALYVSRVVNDVVGPPEYEGHYARPVRADTLSGWFDGARVVWHRSDVTRLPYDMRAARFVGQSEVQWALRERICQLYPCFGMAGECVPCP